MNLKKIVSLILAMVMLLGVITVSVEAESGSAHVPITANGAPMSITVDGEVSYEEWGTPDGSWTWSKTFYSGGKERQNSWQFDSYTGTQNIKPWFNQSINLYARACDDGIYLAFQLVGAYGRDQQETVTSPRKSAGLDFSIGTYNSVDNVNKNDKGTELRYTYRIFETYNSDTKEYTTNLIPASSEPPLDQVQVGFDYDTNTYTYEVRVPYDARYIIEGGDIVLSFALRDKYVDGCAYANVYYFSTAVGHHFWNLGDGTTRKSPFKDYNPIRLTFPECYVNYTASPMPDQVPTMDGSVTEAEWGNPIIVTNRDHANKTWADGHWQSERAHYDADQRAKVWLTNDDTYMYIAATLDKESLGEAWTTDNGNVKMYPQLGLMLAARGETTDLQKNSDGKEIRTEFTFSFDKDGNPVAKVSGKYIIRPTTLSDSDWGVTFNKETGTYTYEARISYAMTNIDPIASNKIAMSVYLSSSNHGTHYSGGNNRYNLGGPGYVNSSYQGYQGKCLLMTLNSVVGEDTYIGETSAIPNKVRIDGKIGDTEYGKAYAVVNPLTDDSIITYTKPDATNRRNDQRAKLWIANDMDYIYIAATLNRSERGLILDKAELNNKGDIYPRLLFSLANWEEETTVPVDGGVEQFSRYSLTLTNEGMVCTDLGSGVHYPLTTQDYIAVFDEDAKTYIYEVRIPIRATNIEYEKNDYETVGYMALSAQIGTSTYVESIGNNRYNFTLGASSNVNNPHKNKGALKIEIYKPNPATFGTYANDTVEEKKGDISIDANVSTQEWGEPIIVTSPAHADKKWGEDGHWAREEYDQEQRAKIYATNDREYIYLAVTLDKAGNSVPAPMELSPAIGVSLSAWNSATTVQQTQAGGTTKEQFSYFRIGWINGAPAVFVDSSGMDVDKVVLGDEDWAIRFDAGSRTYTYELRIPFTSTNISLHDTTEVAMSLQIGDANGGTNADGENNRYNIGGTGAANQNQADEVGKYPHINQAMKLNLRQQYYVADQVSNPNDKVEIDGKISASEWGQPIIVTNPNHTQETWKLFEANEPSYVDQSQTARVWLTSDEHYLYVGATLDKSDKETTDKNRYGTDLSNDMRSHFMFDIGRYVEETTVPRSTYRGESYENYVGYILSLDKDGKQTVTCRSLGMDEWTPDKSDYKITYDAATGTYTYEMRIPYHWTQIQPYGGDMVFCGSLGTTYMGEGTRSNRYHFETGHTGDQRGGDESHKGHMIKLTLNTPDFGVVNDAVSPFSGNVVIDGTLNTGEWGEPLIVTNPAHTKGQWGYFWCSDKKSVDPYQTVKIYATNDAENLYFAATVDRTNFDTSDKANYARAHFFISLGRHDEETDMERIVSLRKTYERFAMYKLYFDAEGQAVLDAAGYGMDILEEKDCDFAIVYDEATRTYTYEIRIPINKTSLRFGNDDQMQVCFTASPAYTGGKEATRYNIGGTGTAYASNTPNKFAHSGQSLTVKLNPNAYSDPLDVYDLSAVNANYIKNTSKNPNSGDTILSVVAVAWISACGLIVTVAMRKKRIGK